MKTESLAKLFKALGHPLRLKIVKKLTQGELCVCELNADVDFSQSNLSQHLKILKEAGILKSHKIGLNIYYSVQDEKINDIIVLAENLLNDQSNL